MTTFQLRQIESATRFMSPIARRYFELQPQALGNAVSESFTAAISSCALASNLMYRAVMNLLMTDSYSPAIEARQVTQDCSYQDCFFSLLENGILLLGLYRRFVDS